MEAVACLPVQTDGLSGLGHIPVPDPDARLARTGDMLFAKSRRLLSMVQGSATARVVVAEHLRFGGTMLGGTDSALI